MPRGKRYPPDTLPPLSTSMPPALVAKREWLHFWAQSYVAARYTSSDQLGFFPPPKRDRRRSH